MRKRIKYKCKACNTTHIKNADEESEIFNDTQCPNYPRCNGFLQIIQ